MKRLLTGLCVLTLGASLLAGCTESRSDRVGEGPGERTPSASPQTAPPPTQSPTPSTPSSPPSQSPSGGGPK
jgi:hypothetical protein